MRILLYVLLLQLVNQTNVKSSSVSALFKLLKKLASESNKCILFSTHDIDLAIQLSDEMIVMTQGKVVQDQPCNLISGGIFDTLFIDENIKFDSEKGRFMIR